MNELLDAALALTASGFNVFPCAPKGKTPATPHSFKDATTDRATIEGWWRACPDYNLAVATGKLSGIFVLDIDGAEAEAELRRLEETHSALPKTYEVVTGKGRHAWFEFPNQPVRNSASKIAPGIDVRGDGGYVLAPPSVHPSGRRYEHSVDGADEIAEAPAWLIELAAGEQLKAPVPGADWADLIAAGVPEGRRDCTVTRLAGYLLARHVDPEAALELLSAWNETRCTPPLPARDIKRIVNSIASREFRKDHRHG